MRDELSKLFPEGLRLETPSGEVPLGGARQAFVLAGGLDLFFAERRAEGSHGRPYSLGGRLGPGVLVPPLPADDPDFVFYARPLPGTELALLDTARCRELIGARDPLLSSAAFAFARESVWPSAVRDLDAYEAGLAAWLAQQRRRPADDRAQKVRMATAYASAQKVALRDSLTLFKGLFGRSSVDEMAPDGNDPVGAAARRVAKMGGITLRDAPGADVRTRLHALAARNRIRIPPVPLHEGWYREDFLPMLVVSADGASAWCVYRTPLGESVAWDGATGETYVADDRLASLAAPEAWTFVRPLPEGRVSLRSIIDLFLVSGGRTLLWLTILLAGIVSCLSMFVPVVTSLVFSDVVPHADYGLLGQLGLLALVFSAAESIIYYIQLRSIERFRSRGGYLLQMALFDRMLRLPPAFFRDYRPAELNSRVQTCVVAIKRAVTSVVKVLSDLIMLLVPLVMMFCYSSVLAALVLCVLVLHLVAAGICYYHVVRCQGEVTFGTGRLTGLVERFVKGAPKLQAAGAENNAFRRWADDFVGIERTVLRGARWNTRAQVFTSLLTGSVFCCDALVLVWGYFHHGAAGVMAMSDYAGFVSTVALVTGYFAWILTNVDPIVRALPQLAWMKPVLEAEEEPHGMLAGLDPEAFTGAVELDHVSFAYPGGRKIFDDVSLRADPGEFVAITGSSGAGKSTLLRLMLRFEQPTHGSVLYDRKDVAQCDMTALRARIGVVMQNAAVMPDTVLRNITGYGTSYTEEEAWEAARLAGCEDVIRAFPQQMQTVLSGGGVSGGQRQRFLLAHAMIRKPKLFFLDEATCSLDNATQRVVVDSLAKMKATRIVIAHRLSTIRDADRIYVLDGGRVAEVGTFDELMAKDGVFARMAKRQMTGSQGE